MSAPPTSSQSGTAASSPSSSSSPDSDPSSTMSSASSSSPAPSSSSTGPDPSSSNTSLNSSPTAVLSSSSAAPAPSSATSDSTSTTQSSTAAPTSPSDTATSSNPPDTTSPTQGQNSSAGSSPAPTDTTATQTSPAPGSSSGSSSTDAGAAPASSSTSVSTIVQTIVQTTNGQTQTVAVTSQITSTTTSSPDGSSTNSSGSDSHTGAIVGGIVGGVAAIALLALLAWFIRRRRTRSEFDGNFDPDHVAARDESTIHRLGRGGDADLLAAARGVDEPEVTPYTYGMQQHHPGGASLLGPGAAIAGAGAYGAYDHKGGRPLSDGSYYDPNAPSMPSGPSDAGSGSGSGHGLSDPRTSLSMSSNGVPYGASPYSPVGGPGGYGVGMALSPGMYQPGPIMGSATPSAPSTYSTQSGAPVSAKEREAFAARYANQMGQGQQSLYGGSASGPASIAGGSSGAAPPLTLRNASAEDEAASVVVHQDGGRVREDSEPMNEIPPTYDSIRSDDEHHQ